VVIYTNLDAWVIPGSKPGIIAGIRLSIVLSTDDTIVLPYHYWFSDLAVIGGYPCQVKARPCIVRIEVIIESSFYPAMRV
jgi:hypothetical protein